MPEPAPAPVPTNYFELGRGISDKLTKLMAGNQDAPVQPATEQPPPPATDQKKQDASPPPPPPKDESKPQPTTDDPLAAELQAIDKEESPHDAKGWAKFKEGRKELLKKQRAAEKAASDASEKLKKLEADLVSARSATPQDYEAIKKERDTTKEALTKLDEIVRRHFVADHPGFKAEFDAQIDAKIEMAKRIVGPEKGAMVERILRRSTPDERQIGLEEVLVDLTAIPANRVSALLNDIEAIHLKREQQIAQWSTPEGIAQIKAVREREAEAARSEESRKVKAMVGSIRSTEGFSELTDDDVQAVHDVAMVPPTTIEELQSRLQQVAQGRLYPKMKSALDAANARIADLEKQIQGFQASTPSVSQQTKTETKPKTEAGDRAPASSYRQVGQSLLERLKTLSET